MVQSLIYFQQKAEELKSKILDRYPDNKILAKQLIKGAEQNADYMSEENESEERWHINFIDELENRLE